jgi:hypothetical protein
MSNAGELIAVVAQLWAFRPSNWTQRQNLQVIRVDIVNDMLCLCVDRHTVTRCHTAIPQVTLWRDVGFSAPPLRSLSGVISNTGEVAL